MPKNVSKLMRKIINIFCYVMNIKISSDKQLTDIKAGSGAAGCQACWASFPNSVWRRARRLLARRVLSATTSRRAASTKMHTCMGCWWGTNKAPTFFSWRPLRAEALPREKTHRWSMCRIQGSISHGQSDLLRERRKAYLKISYGEQYS